MQKFQQFIDGEYTEAKDYFPSINPATEEHWALMPEASAEDVDRAVKAAHRALSDPAWAGLSATARGKKLAKLADLIERDADKIAEIETMDSGKIIRETSAQISYVADYYRYYAGLADKMEGSHLPIDKPDMDVTLQREPLGVVAAVVPWNSQLFLSAVKIGPALAAGCTVVVKASEDGAGPHLAFAQLFEEAGFPKGVIHFITGHADVGKILTSHPLVMHVAFTGGPQTASHVVRNTAQNLASLSLELGGKSPFIVFNDADLESAANAQVAGIFAASGQSCVAGSRLVVQKGIKDALVARLKEKAEKIVIGSPMDSATEMGPLCTQEQIDLIEKALASSVAKGATIITGGERLERKGYYFQPTIIDCTDVPDAQTAVDEMFGPVLSVIGFDTEEEAISIANNTRFGLASGVFTKDLARGHRMVKAIKAGVVWVNTYRAISPMAPFGGHGFSGFGREAGIDAALRYTKLKAVWIRTSEDPILDPFIIR